MLKLKYLFAWYVLLLNFIGNSYAILSNKIFMVRYFQVFELDRDYLNSWENSRWIACLKTTFFYVLLFSTLSFVSLWRFFWLGVTRIRGCCGFQNSCFLNRICDSCHIVFLIAGYLLMLLVTLQLSLMASLFFCIR